MTAEERPIEAIKSLLKAENIDFNDNVNALKTLNETVAPKYNKRIYLQYIVNVLSIENTAKN